MQIILWRHAEAEDVAATDLARPLTKRGHQQAAHMAAWLQAQLGDDFSRWRIIVSPALRTQETAKALRCAFETIPSIAPEASPDAVLTAADWPNSTQPTLVVGHQPTLGMVAARLLHGEEGYVTVKKGAMWWFELRQRNGNLQTVLKAMVTPDSVAG